ncbi:uncharacterized protein CDAR_38191 [Caerostris darwini]|uniref:Uncharacterized protein n=1 Tax=Caerostris darwini TaxID=1538125 RepID=A0AAV4T9J8_9ARAC|nr:uncharacterized protein CDAR_38191 [Caerostris darwini]
MNATRQLQAVDCASLTNTFLHCQASNGHVDTRQGANYLERLRNIFEFVENELGPGNNPPGSNHPGNYSPGNHPSRPMTIDRTGSNQRRSTVQKLNELREKLCNTCIVINYVKAGGNVAELSGAVANIVGALMAFLNLPSGQTVLLIGNLVNNAGTFASKLSRLVEILLSNIYLKELENILKKEPELSCLFQKWLMLPSDMEEKFRYVSRLFLEFSSLYISMQSFSRTLKLMDKERYSLHIGTDVRIGKLMEFCHQLGMSPELSEKCRKMCFATTPHLMTVIYAPKVYNLLCGKTTAERTNTGTGEATYNEANRMTSLLDGRNADIPTATQVSVYSAFQALNALTSIVSLQNAMYIIRISAKYSEALKLLSDLSSFQ